MKFPALAASIKAILKAAHCRSSSSIDVAAKPPMSSQLRGLCVVATAIAVPVYGAELPVACVAGSCGTNVQWVGSGAATLSQGGNTLNVNQSSQNAVFNWQSFNISADGTVNFNQPDATSVALNRIFQADPSRIQGALNANGQVYLINQNGILFGSGARVNVGGLIASTLNVTPEAAGGLLNAIRESKPAFAADADTNGSIKIESGAVLNAAEGGQLMVLSKNIENAGSLSAPGGQVILAAGDSVYLYASDDTNLRGLLVEVGQGGTVTNTAQGDIASARGNVTLIGSLVNQSGRVSATTSVRQNGSIRLLARDDAAVHTSGDIRTAGARRGGTLELGEGSVTEISLEQDPEETAVDVTDNQRSFVELDGRQVALRRDSLVKAKSGEVTVVARGARTPGEAAGSTAQFGSEAGDGRLHVESGARIDVSGENIELPMERNLLRVELRGSQLADSPQQRDGALRGATVYVDIRQSGTRADGSTWQGSPIGDLSGDLSTIQRTVAERNLAGGSISLIADGAVFVDSGAELDISGGSIRYLDGYLNTTRVLGANGRIYDIASADPDRAYSAILDSSYAIEHYKWGVTEVFTGFIGAPQGRFEAGYIEGKDAGRLNIAAHAAVLDGSIRANVVVGPHQRNAPAAMDEAVLYRPYNQVPLAGGLTLGGVGLPVEGRPNYLMQDVAFGTGLRLPALTNADGSLFDPLLDTLPEELGVVELRPELFAEGGLGRLSVRANGTFTLADDTLFTLPEFGELDVTAGVIDVGGQIHAHGGKVALTSGLTADHDVGGTFFTLHDGAAIDVSGWWVNDRPQARGPVENDPLVIDGGTVSLSAEDGGSLVLEAGSAVDASGGAWRRGDGTVQAGLGGTIDLAALPYVVEGQLPAPSEMLLGAELRAFAIEHGGTLDVSAGSICIAVDDCAGVPANALQLAPLFFETGGFERYSLTANVAGLTLESGTALRPRQMNYQITREFPAVATGAALDSFLDIALSDDLLRRPVDLALIANGGGERFTAATVNDGRVLTIGTGSSIALDPLAQLVLAANTSMFIDGRLDAPAGSIDVAITTGMIADDFYDEFLSNQGIWLGVNAQLLAAGTARTFSNDLGRVQGQVFDGGSISVRANRGYLITDPGSIIDVSGTEAAVDIRTGPGSARYERRSVGSSGGSIQLGAAEGMLLNGELAAHAGNAGTIGGSLDVRLDAATRGTISQLGGAELPSSPRELRLHDDGPVIVQPFASVAERFSGRGMLSAEHISAGGFDDLNLTATNVFRNDGSVASTGIVLLEPGIALEIPGSIRINAQTMRGLGGANLLSAAYVGLGNDDVEYSAAASSVAGFANLTVRAGLIDLIGNLGLEGFADVRFESAGDIRLRGIQVDQGQELQGRLSASGTVQFAADQLYPTTQSNFAIDIGPAAQVGDLPGTSLLRITGGAADAAPVYSAGGALSLAAHRIEQGGTLRAPFGQITFDAAELVLQSGSVTSTSADGLAIPFGQIQAGTDWVYQYPVLDSFTEVFAAEDGPPAQRILLQGDQVNVEQGAELDIRGGGDMLAYEFIRGVGGTRDVLANDSSGQFAILPASSLQFAPYDSYEQVGFSYTPGDSVYLSGLSGVPAGKYAILPARYALLPGAYLVRPVDGYQDIAPGEAHSQLNGSTIVSGYFTQAGTDSRESRTHGFAVYSRDQVSRLAQYDISTANDFFTAAASAAELAAPRLARDGGTLQIAARQTLDFLGELTAAPAEDGRGGRVDISSERLRVVDAAGSADAGEYVLLQASQLNALQAESLLIGGTRIDQAGATAVAEVAAEVIVDAGVELSGPELLLAADERVGLMEGASLRASGGTTDNGATEEQYALDWRTSLVRVSGDSQISVKREMRPATATGTGAALILGNGSRLGATGSATIDAAGVVRSQALFDVDGASLSLGATEVALGEAPARAGGLVLSAVELAGLTLDELRITSTNHINIYGAVDLDIDGDLQLRAPGLRAASADASASFAADTVRLRGSDDEVAVTSSFAAGSLSISGAELLLDSGEFVASGFSNALLTGTKGIVAAEDGELSADGSLTLATPLLTTLDGAAYSLKADGDLRVTGRASSEPSDLGGVGGRLSLNGQHVEIDSLVRTRGGVIEASASGNVVLTANALVDTQGFERTFDDLTVEAAGGSVLVSSEQGDVELHEGSIIDVSSAGGDGQAGRVSLVAAEGRVSTQGTLLAQGAAGEEGGTFNVEALTFTDLDTLNSLLNAGGFSGSRHLHQRGPGDLILSAGASMNARDIQLAADQGSIFIHGTVDASGERAGSVGLFARDTVTVTGSIDASASAPGETGGRVSLGTNAGSIVLADSASIDVSAGAGATGGELKLRTQQSALATLLDADAQNDLVRLGGSVQGAAVVEAEGFAAYADEDGSISASEVAADMGNVRFADAMNFMQDAAALADVLRAGRGLNVEVVPGIEITFAGDAANPAAPLTVATDWNLAAWNAAGLGRGNLTLRAQGDLIVNGSLNDGFLFPTSNALPATPAESWSYRLAGGANLAAVNPLSTLVSSELAEDVGDVELAANRRIRTGTGDIDIAAGGDLRLAAQNSVIYTAGLDSGVGVRLPNLGSRVYPEQGGDISIHVGGDIAGMPSNQLITNWLWRTGRDPAGLTTGRSATGWTISYQHFEQGIGALAGGNIDIFAGGDISNLDVSIPTIGRQVGGVTPELNEVEVIGGGRLAVESLGSIAGGVYFVGAGEGRITAADSFTADAGNVAPVLALGDTQLHVSARDDLRIETILTPFKLPWTTGNVQGFAVQRESYFSTYGEQAAVSLTASAGDLAIVNKLDNSALRTRVSTLSWGEIAALIFPPAVHAAALGGDLSLEGSLYMWPSVAGQLDLLAEGNIELGTRVTDFQLFMADADPLSLSTPARPTTQVSGDLAVIRDPVVALIPQPRVPIHSAAFGENEEDDPQPARIIARSGDIRVAPANPGQGAPIFMPKPANIIAGRDILDLHLEVQNLSGADVSRIEAGRDFRYSVIRQLDTRELQQNLNEVLVHGPGQLTISAGRDVNLQTSQGITSRGDQDNSSLPDSGASITVMAGLGESGPAIQAFTDKYLVEGSLYDEALIEFVNARVTAGVTTKEAALAEFGRLSTAERFTLLQELFLTEVREGGRAAAKPGPDFEDYSRSFAALQALFPGSNPHVDGGEANPYAGDVSLYFSRIYTEDGGDINFFVPGGGVNVGLASPPSAFGVAKQPSQLGIVVQSNGNVNSVAFGNFAVNESRVFAADGGNILVWSTRGDIDAGRGAKTAISAPAPTVVFNEDGKPEVRFPPALTGSGIQTLATSAEREPGDVDLYAPRGVVNAGDAGIVAGNLTIGATAVLGADNIQVSGVSVGVPVDTGGLGTALSGVSNVASSASTAAAAAVEPGRGKDEEQTPIADTALSWLEVFVVGLGEENCKQDDIECLKRQP